MYDFQEIAEALNSIACTSSTLEKERLLVKFGKEVEGFKEVLKFIYDPYFTTGLKQAKLDNATFCASTSSVEEIMKYLRVNNTGTMLDVELALGFIVQGNDDVWDWAAEGLVTKDLQIGVSVTTLNKVYGKGFIPKIGIMRGMLCPDTMSGYHIATEKIDGNRRLIFTRETGVDIYTRSGKPDNGLVDIVNEALELLPIGYVFDCECIATGEYVDSVALRQASASILNRKLGTKKGVKALCFDVLPIEEYDQGRSKFGALARKTIAAAMMGDEMSCVKLLAFAQHYDESHVTHLENSVSALWGMHRRTACNSHELIVPLPILGFVQHKAEGIELAKPIWDTGGEGVMLVKWDSPYEVNPNPRKTLLKIKATKEYELKCIGLYEGTGKYQGIMGGIEVAYECLSDGKTYKVGVGSGFTDWERQQYWSNPDSIVGKIVEIDSFGESKNDQGGYSLNCPIFKRIKGDTSNE